MIDETRSGMIYCLCCRSWIAGPLGVVVKEIDIGGRRFVRVKYS